jgi:hypothetical protein
MLKGKDKHMRKAENIGSEESIKWVPEPPVPVGNPERC